jgi:hypothetical protein
MLILIARGVVLLSSSYTNLLVHAEGPRSQSEVILGILAESSADISMVGLS